jgi:hypothetical protein
VLLHIKKFKIIYLQVLKIVNKLLEVRNDVSHKYAESQFKIFHILSNTKVIKVWI